MLEILLPAAFTIIALIACNVVFSRERRRGRLGSWDLIGCVIVSIAFSGACVLLGASPPMALWITGATLALAAVNMSSGPGR